MAKREEKAAHAPPRRLIVARDARLYFSEDGFSYAELFGGPPPPEDSSAPERPIAAAEVLRLAETLAREYAATAYWPPQ